MSKKGLLLDTHVWIWFKAGIETLTTVDINNINNAHDNNKLFLSSISIWEVAMLQKQGRLALHYPILKWVGFAVRGIQTIPINDDIAIESVILPEFEHKDPADRFILATARLFELELLTKDAKLLEYIKKGFI